MGGVTVKAVEHYDKARGLMVTAEQVLRAGTSYDHDPRDFTRTEMRLEDTAVHTEVSALAGLARAHLAAAELMFKVKRELHDLPDDEATAWRQTGDMR